VELPAADGGIEALQSVAAIKDTPLSPSTDTGLHPAE
jgi:hypothetical protein